ncbi:MAG: hypothetical protein V1758_05900 [Pseudomonadota bacterium]
MHVSSPPRKRLPWSLTLFLFISLMSLPALANPEQGTYQSLPGLIDLRTSFSDSPHTMEEIVGLARSRGFKVICFTDHDRIALSYGVPPFRNILRYKKAFPSIMTHGIDKYLAEIDRLSKKYPDMILIPGCITSPYYYWTGSFFQGNLTAHEYDRRILIIGFNKPEDYRFIPNMDSPLSLKHTSQLLPGLIIFLIPFVIGLILLRWRGPYRWVGIVLVLFSTLAVIDYNPFRGSLRSPYQGDHGIAPFQEVIDYVNERGGLSFWNYPEQRSGLRKHGPIHVSTPPYPQVLHQSSDYTGFAAIYGDHITVTDPGKEWDRVLNEYCRGRRERPPWGISTADFHQDGRLGLKLGDFPTTFLVREFSKKGVLEAMKKGRMYASRSDGRTRPLLEYFNVMGNETDMAFMGETLRTARGPVIRFKVSFEPATPAPVTVYLIRGGTLIRTFEGTAPLEVEYADHDAPSGEMTYYRLIDSRKHLTSNPIFVRYEP